MTNGEQGEAQFRLSAEPPPSRRTQAGRKERETVRYRQADTAYNVSQAIASAIRNQRPLTTLRLRQLGAPSLGRCLLHWRADFRRLMATYRVRSIADLFRHCYGRTPPHWQFHHVQSPRRLDFSDTRQMHRCLHFTNLRPITAEENLQLMARELRAEKLPPEAELKAIQLPLFLFPNSTVTL